MEAKFSSAAMTALGLLNINAVPRVAATDLFTKERRHGCADVSTKVFDTGDESDAAAANSVVRPSTIDGSFGMKDSHLPMTETATTMDNDALFVDDTMVMVR
jgi:hypothetical protein